MNGPRHQFLACAGFSLDQNSGVGRGHSRDMPQHFLNGRRVPQNFVEAALGADLSAQVGGLSREPFPRLVDFAVLHGIVERDRNLIGDLLQEVRIGFRETMRMPVQQMQHSNLAIAAHQRQETATLHSS